MGKGKYIRACVLVLAFLCACSDQNSAVKQPANQALAPVTDAYLDQLGADDRYYVINRLHASLYKGVPLSQYFDVSRGLHTPVNTGRYTIQAVRTALGASGDIDALTDNVEQKYFINSDGEARWNPLEVPLAYLYELPLSREYFDFWIAYQLVNNILFSPGLELTSVQLTDVQTIYARLVEALALNKPIREIVYEHVTSEENWRRFRSPEDNVREMMEIYLQRFRDEEVPRAATACKNWFLTEEEQHFKLLRTVNVNRTPQSVLDRSDVVSCEDFYRALANHEDLIPTVVNRIVAQFFPASSNSQRRQIADALLAENVQTFGEIFSRIIFSRAFLLEQARVKTFEELFFNVAENITWTPHRRYFDYITRQDSEAGIDRRNLRQIKQEAMTYKLGRHNEVPTDTMSLSYLQSMVRFSLFSNVAEPNDTNLGWSQEFVLNNNVQALSDEDFIDYVLLSTIARRATNDERATLLNVLQQSGFDGFPVSKAKIIFDYVSQMPEFYYFRGANDA
jgi:hypothetical protein